MIVAGWHLSHKSGHGEFIILQLLQVACSLYKLFTQKMTYWFNTKKKHERKMADKLKAKLNTRARLNFNIELCRITK